MRQFHHGQHNLVKYRRLERSDDRCWHLVMPGNCKTNRWWDLFPHAEKIYLPLATSEVLG